MIINRVHLCLYIASFFEYLALKSSKIPLICKALPIPGWFVVHEHIIHITSIKNGNQWDCYDMPDAWCNIIEKARRKEINNDRKN